jgi:hypothetical protein
VLLRTLLVFATAAGLLAADRSFISYATAKRAALPPELKNASDSGWRAWCIREDKAIRARLEQGELDSMVNFLLYGTSFTQQPRISMQGEGIREASKAGVLRARVDDLVAGITNPGDNERLVFLQHLLKSQGINLANPRQTGVFILQNLQRVVQERKTFADRAAADSKAAGSGENPSVVLDRFSLFRDRGVSLDTSIIPDYSIDQTLRDLKERGVLREGQIARVAVIGPGLDFIDKNEESAYDFYPEQTLQPFALYDSLLHLGLGKANAVSISILDISDRVIQHLERARQRAAKGTGYIVQLPHDVARPWPEDIVRYWTSLGDQVGRSVPSIPPPHIFEGLKTRAIEIRPQVVLACEPIDLNVVLQRLSLAAEDRFDLIVATNIFVYYNSFEQSLALENTGAMLKPGGLLLTNDRLPTYPGGSMRMVGITVVPFGGGENETGGKNPSQGVAWYGKQ